jgi:hypothetical protein
MPSEIDEAYEKIQNFAEDIMRKYQETKHPKKSWVYRLRQEALHDCLKCMRKHGIIAGFDRHEHKIFME